MSNRWVRSALASASLLGIAAMAAIAARPAAAGPPADGDAAVREEIAAEYAAYDEAALRGVRGLLAWCEENLAPEFELREAGGAGKPLDRFMAELRRMADDPDPLWQAVTSQRTTIDRLEVAGDAAVAHITTRGEYAGRDAAGHVGPKGAEHTFASTAGYRETWVRKDGDWKVAKAEQVSQEMRMDGEPFPPAKP